MDARHGFLHDDNGGPQRRDASSLDPSAWPTPGGHGTLAGSVSGAGLVRPVRIAPRSATDLQYADDETGRVGRRLPRRVAKA